MLLSSKVRQRLMHQQSNMLLILKIKSMSPNLFLRLSTIKFVKKNKSINNLSNEMISDVSSLKN